MYIHSVRSIVMSEKWIEREITEHLSKEFFSIYAISIRQIDIFSSDYSAFLTAILSRFS